MTKIKFFCPIKVRYGDLDPQGHVNNAKYLTYFEHARTLYLREVGLFKEGRSFMDIGVILADVHISFLKPIHWEDNVIVGVKAIRLGKKSITVAQLIQSAETDTLYSEGEVVMVTYDYHSGKTIQIPDEWRNLINIYEGYQL